MNGRSAMYKDEDRAPIKGGGGEANQIPTARFRSKT